MTIWVMPAKRGHFVKELNRSGWVDGEVIAAGELRQGRPRSLLAQVFGLGLLERLRPLGTELVPRRFVLAATSDSVLAFDAKGVEDPRPGGTYQVRIEPGQRASFAREDVSIAGDMMAIGAERFRVAKPNPQYGDKSTDELIALLSRP